MNAPVRICFVCLGNICRSPTAEGVFLTLVRRAKLDQHFVVDSAGTGGWHAGESPDPRSVAAAKARGVHLPSVARQFGTVDFERFDYILCMDESNRRNVLALAPNSAGSARVHLLREFDPSAQPNAEVPDPYYGGPNGFDEVLNICEQACGGFLEVVRQRHGL